MQDNPPLPKLARENATGSLPGLRAIVFPPVLYFKIARYADLLPSWHISKQ